MIDPTKAPLRTMTPAQISAACETLTDEGESAMLRGVSYAHADSHRTLAALESRGFVRDIEAGDCRRGSYRWRATKTPDGWDAEMVITRNRAERERKVGEASRKAYRERVDAAARESERKARGR